MAGPAPSGPDARDWVPLFHNHTLQLLEISGPHAILFGVDVDVLLWVVLELALLLLICELVVRPGVQECQIVFCESTVARTQVALTEPFLAWGIPHHFVENHCRVQEGPHCDEPMQGEPVVLVGVNV